MRQPVLTLCLTAVAVFASEVALPVSVKFGDGLVTFSAENDAIFYAITDQDAPTVRSTLSAPGSSMGRSDRKYSVDDCATSGEACVKLSSDDFDVLLRRNINSRFGYTHAFMNTTQDNSTVGTCVELGDKVHWFGGPESWEQPWPVEVDQWNYTAYYPKEDQGVSIVEPYWVSSEGTFFYVNPESSLFIDQNHLYDGYLCIYAENVSPYRKLNHTRLEYWIGNYGDPRTAHEAAVEKFFTKPTGIPDERTITHPIWSTWARYKVNVSDPVVREFANSILEHGFNHSQLEIDDYWETCYGSLTFDTGSNKFPNIKKLTDDLHELGFRVTLWVHPFINVECAEYYEFARSNGYFVENEDGEILSRWWQGENTSVIDFTNEAAAAWYTGRLTALKASAGIDSFKFDAGEASWSPEPAVLTGPVELSPGIYTANYARILSQFGGAMELRTGWHTQDVPVLVRMLDKESDWTLNMGFASLITTLLVMNMAGYPYVLPDMVGGNGHVNGSAHGTLMPQKELYVRWLQANTFMPAIQYSFVPWDFDDETVDICRKYTDIHAEYAPTIIEAMNAAVVNGTPVNPPVWWLDPTNSDAYNISDEYLLGEVIVVAPVMVEGAATRDIFLPKGSWVDASSATHKTYEGPVWIRDYPAPLEVLPYFVEANYWASLGKTTSGAFPQSSSLSVICASAIVSLVAKLFN